MIVLALDPSALGLKHSKDFPCSKGFTFATDFTFVIAFVAAFVIIAIVVGCRLLLGLLLGVAVDLKLRVIKTDYLGQISLQVVIVMLIKMIR